jgi:hypothetical protein
VLIPQGSIALDNCGTVSFTNDQPPVFPVGITAVTWTATDASHNSSTCIQHITRSAQLNASITMSEMPVFCQGETVTLTAHNPGTSPVTYLWSTGETTASIQVSTSGNYSVTISNMTGCQSIGHLTVTIDITGLLSSYVMLTDKHIHLEGTTVYSGGLGVMDGYHTYQGKIEAKQQTKVTAAGTFAKADHIDVDPSSVITNKNLSAANVTLPPFETVNAHGTINIQVHTGTTVTLSGSLYKEIKVEKNATLVINTPVIDISKGMHLDDGAILKFAQCTRVHMGGNLETGKNVTIDLEGTSVIWYIDGDAHFHEGNNVTGAFYLGTSNPHYSVVLKHVITADESKATRPGIYKGMFLAEDIESHKNNHWYLNPICNFCNPVLPKEFAEENSTVNTNEAVVKNFPNPFSNNTTVSFTLPEDTHVKLEVFDISGKCIQTLFNDNVQAGNEYKADFNGDNLNDGIYFYRLTTTDNVIIGKMMLVR